MSNLYKVITEEISDFSEDELQLENEKMFNVRRDGDEDHDGSIVSWKGKDEDLERMGCEGMTIRSIFNSQGYFIVQTWDRSEYACRVHAMHDDAVDILPAEHCIRFVGLGMNRPTTLFIDIPGIEWGLSQKSSRQVWQQKAFRVCSEHLESLKEGNYPGFPRRSFWRHQGIKRLGKKLAEIGIKEGIKGMIGG